MHFSFVTFGFGLLLGIKHAFEADHLIAVSTIVSEQKKPSRAALIGTYWGIGHTTTLFIVGLVALLLKISIPERISLILELLVGIMLIILGIRAVFKRTLSYHSHVHHHEGMEHTHVHSSHSHRHSRSFVIGAIHGLAGSGALMILVLSTIRSLFEGVLYILLFGLGSVISMSILSFIIGLPFIYSTRKFEHLDKFLRLIAGVLSIFFGIFMIYEIGFVEGLFLNIR